MTLRTFSLITNVIFLNLWNKIEYNKGMKKISLLEAKSNLFMASCTTCTTESVIYSHNPCPFNWNVEITWHECWTGESFSIKIFCKENGFANTQQYLFVTFSCIPNGVWPRRLGCSAPKGSGIISNKRIMFSLSKI